MFGRQPMSSISSWHPSTRSLMNLSVRESPMSSQLRFYRVTSHISHIVHKTHSYRDEHSHSGPWSQVCIVGGGVTSAVSPCPELTHARPQSPANWHLLGGKFRGQIMLSPDTLPLTWGWAGVWLLGQCRYNIYCTDSYSEGSINLGGCCSLTVFCGNNLFSSGRLIQSSSFLPSMRIWSGGGIKARAPNPDILPPLARLQHPAAVLQLSHNTVDSGQWTLRPPSQPQLSGSGTRHMLMKPTHQNCAFLHLHSLHFYTPLSKL